MKYGELTLGQIEAMVNKLGGMTKVRLFLSDGLVVTEVPSRTEAPTGTTIHVDRSVCPSYPDWVKEVLHPDLENAGPAEYDLVNVELWLHDGQKDGKYVEGNRIYEYLKTKEMLAGCLGLRDLEEIQKKDVTLFRKLFGNKAIFGWKSVARRRYGSLYVPYLYGSGDWVVVSWFWLVNGWSGSYPAARFAST